MKITINLDEREQKILEKRAKKNLMELKEQVEDIIRRSCINAIKSSSPKDPCDDRLVSIFSKQNKGKKPKKTVEDKQKKKIKSILASGKRQLKKDKQEARKSYNEIRKEYAKLKKQDKKLFEDIVGFYEELTK
jgi:hypothetical protein